MNKIPTVFKRDDANRRHVTREVNPGCEWVLDGKGAATRKYDGTCVMYDGARWWARREVKPGKPDPQGYVLVSTDEITGKSMGWEPIEQSSWFRYVIEAHENYPDRDYGPGTYELCGPKVNGNPEGFDRHMLVRHDDAERLVVPRDYGDLAAWMAETDFEGIVWHHPDGRMAKLKARDLPAAGSQPTESKG